MIRQQIQQLNTDSRHLRKFGWLIGGLLALVGMILFWRGAPAGPYVLVPGAVLAGLGGVAPRWLKPIYLVWMTVGLVLGAIVSALLLTLIFYVAVTPIGLLTRWLGKDFLGTNPRSKAESYWRLREASCSKKPSDYERQF